MVSKLSELLFQDPNDQNLKQGHKIRGIVGSEKGVRVNLSVLSIMYFSCLFRESSIDDENSGESPLISIWGDYTGLYSLSMDQWILAV